MRRRIIALLAFGAFFLGVGNLAGVSLDTPPPDVFITAIGMLALGFAVLAAWRRWQHPPAFVELPDPTVATPVTVPGDALDELINSLNHVHRRHEMRATLRERLTDVAVEILRIYAGMAPDAARAAVRDGSWTNDPLAAATLTPGPDPNQDSVRDVIKQRLGLAHRYEAQLGATVDEIVAVLERQSSISIGSRDREGREHHTFSTSSRAVSGTDGPTRYWTGFEFVAFGSIGVGAIVREPAVVLLGVIGVGYLGYTRFRPVPEPSLSITREFPDRTFEPGETVPIITEIHNTGDRFLPDVRFVDGVPEALVVVDGSARIGTALRPGGTATVRYAVELHRGVHEFEPATAIVAAVHGGYERRIDVRSADQMTCAVELSVISHGLPSRAASTLFSGNVTTDIPGEGTTFHSVRDYRAGDRRTRIDWRRLARTGELATIDYHTERAATVVILLDTRPDAYLTPDAAEKAHTVDRSVTGARALVEHLLAAGNLVGLASIHSEPCWHPPGGGRDTLARLDALLESHPSVGPRPTATQVASVHWLRWFKSRMPANGHVVLFTPLHDDVIFYLVGQLEAARIPVSVISPDATRWDTTGGRLLAMERQLRLVALREAGHTVVDWSWDAPLELALARLTERG